MKPDFIVYLIKRINWMPRMGGEIEYIVASPSALQELLGVTEKAAKSITHIRGQELCLFPGAEPVFLVKLKGGNIHEDWLQDFREEPEPTNARWREIGFRYRQYSVKPGDVVRKPGFRVLDGEILANTEIAGQEKQEPIYHPAPEQQKKEPL